LSTTTTDALEAQAYLLTHGDPLDLRARIVRIVISSLCQFSLIPFIEDHYVFVLESISHFEQLPDHQYAKAMLKDTLTAYPR
jgi:hypothetical protein